MANYSKASMSKLLSCHEDLITLFTIVIQHFDNTILFGHRTPEEQYELYQQGRTKPGDIVTYKDGYDNKSEHNYLPSHAVDAIPFNKEEPHYNWDDIKQLYYWGGYVKGVAKMLYETGQMDHELIWGGDWDDDKDMHDQTLMDLVHFELIM